MEYCWDFSAYRHRIGADGLNRHLNFERNVPVFLLDFSEESSKVIIKLFRGWLSADLRILGGWPSAMFKLFLGLQVSD